MRSNDRPHQVFPSSPFRDWKGWLRLNGSIWPLILLVSLPFLVHLPALGGLLYADPIYFLSGLATEVKPGPFPGLVFNDPNAGWTMEALGRLAARQWLSGEIPWWNPFSGIGVPLAAEMQSAALFLPFILLLSLNHGVIFLKIAVQIVAGFSTYALLRQLKLGQLAAVVGAALYELNGSFAWFWHAPMLPAAFLPLFLLGIERAYSASLSTAESQAKSLIRGWRTIAVAVAYSLYAGFPETAYLDGLMVFLWAAYRIATAPGSARSYVFGRVLIGGLVGLLLAAPILWPFVHLVSHSWLGDHDGMHRLADYAMPAPGFALYLFPYLYGSMGAFIDVHSDLLLMWFLAGGYIGLNIFFIALLGLVGGSHERGLRWLLGSWIAIALAQTAGLPGVKWFFSMIPFMDQTLFARFAPPSWIMATIILASFAIDDKLRSERARNYKQFLVAMFCGCTLLLAMAVAWPHLLDLYHNAPFIFRFSMVSLLWGVLSFALFAFVLVWCGHRATVLAAILLVLESSAFFSIPLLSGIKNAKLDLGAVRFLEANLGLQRFYTLGPIMPNYSAYFGLPSINLNYMPAPTLWTDYMRRELGLEVSGTGVGMYSSDPVAALRQHFSAYQSLGIKYLVLGPGYIPEASVISPLKTNSTNEALQLKTGTSLSGTIPSDLVRPGEIQTFGVTIGTNHGRAEGSLAVKLCTPVECTVGVQSLQGAVDNFLFRIPLKRTLTVRAGDTLKYIITRPPELAGTDVAIWFWPASMPLVELSDSTVPVPGHSPAWTLEYRTESGWRIAYQTRALTVIELPNPTPYFEVEGGPCSLTITGRRNVLASCAAPATLIRHELAFPGWRVTLNENQTPVLTVAKIFQSVRLPATTSQIVFTYEPPGIGWAYAALLLGALATFAPIAAGIRMI